MESSGARADRDRQAESANPFRESADGGRRGPSVQRDARAARRRRDPARDCDVGRSRSDLAQDHVRRLSGNRCNPAAVLVGVRFTRARTGLRSGRRGSPLRRRRLAPRRRRYAPARRTAAAPRLRAVRRDDDRRARGGGGAGDASRARRQRRREIGQQRAAVLTGQRHSRVGKLRSRLRSMEHGRRSRRFVDSALRRAFELHALVRRASRTVSKRRRWRRRASRSAAAFIRTSPPSSRSRCRFSTFSTPTTCTRIATVCAAFGPTRLHPRGTPGTGSSIP